MRSAIARSQRDRGCPISNNATGIQRVPAYNGSLRALEYRVSGIGTLPLALTAREREVLQLLAQADGQPHPAD